MSLEQLSNVAQLVGSIGVIVSLIAVALQIKHNTGALQRNEHNSTMAQWTVICVFQSKSATHSIPKLPLIPVNSATPVEGGMERQPDAG